MQFLHLKKEKVLKNLECKINLEYLKYVQVFQEHSEDLNFNYFLKSNPQYTSYTQKTQIIEDYIQYINEVSIIISSDYYKAVLSYKYSFYKIFFDEFYAKQIYSNAAKLENFISVYKENLISSALVILMEDNVLPESATH